MKNHWKKIIGISSVVFFITFTGHAFGAEDWETVSTEISERQDQAIEGATLTEEYTEMDRAALEKELEDFQAQEKREDAALEKLKAEFQSLRKIEEQLKEDLEEEQEEIDAIAGTVRGAAGDGLEVAYDNPITAEDPDRISMLEQIESMQRMPGLEEIQAIVDFLFKEIDEQGNIVRRSGDFVGPDGKNAIGEIIRIGKWTTFYRMADGSVGFLVPENTGKRLIAITAEIPMSTQGAIKDYFNGKTKIAPIDISGSGLGFTELTESEDWRDKLEQGGPLMYAILAVGIFAILLGIERIIVLGTKARASDKIMDEIKSMVSKGNLKKARDFCSSKSRIPTCQMLDNVMEHGGTTLEVLENALQEAILRQTPKLERFLTTLALLAAISPLLGLLGTVTGMITTFKVITQVGTGDPTMMAGGISEALLTTQFGLVTAVPIMLVHHFLKSQVDKIIGDMQEKGTAFAVTLIKSGGNITEA
jgi:biopolymer transport protein ExbB